MGLLDRFRRRSVSAADGVQRVADGAVLVDVRSAGEWRSGHAREAEQGRDPGGSGEFVPASRAAGEVVLEAGSVVAGEAAEDVGAEQQVRFVVGHRVTPSSSRAVRRALSA